MPSFSSSVPEISLEEFTVLYPMRAPHMMWFLGAGASASSGIQTAWNMIWDFKRALYCAQTKTPIASIPNLSDPIVRWRIQKFFNDHPEQYPPEDDASEYTFYFQKAHPSEMDRRNYIDRMVRDGTPSHGHLVLAHLFQHDKARLVWTTNFDTMVEDAWVRINGKSGGLLVADLGEPDKMLQAMNEARWPALGKIHGDFRSRRLKNTTDELSSQDEQMRPALIEGCKRFGLAVVGYSGRDTSVMETLKEGISNGAGFPQGLFWFHRGEAELLPAVTDLLKTAQDAGIEARLVTAATFDELLDSVRIQISDLPPDVNEHLLHTTPKVSDAPLPGPGGTWPTIRLNALPILEMPTCCRLVECNIGGAKEVKELVSQYPSQIIAARRNVGVIAFGRDQDIKTVFADYVISRFDVHSILAERLNFESAELGLIYDALSHAIERQCPVRIQRRRVGYLIYADPEQEHHIAFNFMLQNNIPLRGKLSGSSKEWNQAALMKLEYRFGKLWLLLQPSIRIDHDDDEVFTEKQRDFLREQLARRYNQQWNNLLKGWIDVLIGEEQEVTFRAFGIGDGIDATFRVGRHTGFSKRYHVKSK